MPDSMGEVCQAPLPIREDCPPGGLRAEMPMVGVSAKIKKVSNGFIVEIGCQTFVSKDWTEVAVGLAEYWDNPEQARRKYCKK